MPTSTDLQHLTLVAAICSALLLKRLCAAPGASFLARHAPPLQCPFSRLLLPPGPACALALARAVAPLTLPPLVGPWAGGGGKEALRGGDPLESAAQRRVLGWW